MHVCLKGSPVQRAALARRLRPEAGYHFPGMSVTAQTPQGLKTSIELVSQLLGNLASHLGVQLSGDVQSVSYTIIQDFGGLSFADFLIFIERCKSGDFRQDFQHVASRGVNYEFLRTWLDAYCEEREACRAAVYDQTKSGKRLPGDGPGSPVPDFVGDMAKERERLKAKRMRLQSEADEIFKAWERELFVTEIVDDYPIERELPGSALRLLKRFLYEFVFYGEGGSKETVQAAEALAEEARLKYADSQEESLDNVVSAELRAILAELESFRSAVTAFDLCVRGLAAANPDKSGSVLQRAAAQYLREFEAAYLDEYLPACIERKYPRLSEEDFIWKCSYTFYVNASGKHPLLEILNDNHA